MSDSPPCEALPSAQALAAAQLALLRRLAEIGLELAEGLKTDVTGQVRAIDRERQALEAEGDVWTPLAPLPVFTGDIGLVYARITRAVRLTLALQTRILRGLERPGPSGASHAGRPGGGPSDSRATEEIATESRERLIDRDDLASMADLPFDDAVAIICHDLGLPAEGTASFERPKAQAAPAPLQTLNGARSPTARLSGVSSSPAWPSGPSALPCGP